MKEKYRGKEEFIMEETYKTINGEYKFRGQKREEELYFYEEIKNYIEDGRKKLLTVWGLPGCGKSYLMRKIVGQLNMEKREKSIFAVYLDISDCADESEVYYKIAMQLDKFYEIQNSISSVGGRKEVKKLISLYEWVEGFQRKNYFGQVETVKNVVDMADSIIKKIDENLKNFDDERDEKEKVFLDALLSLSEILPFTKNIKWLVETAFNIRNAYEKHEFKKWLLEKLDILENKAMRQNFFLNELIKALAGVSRRMIVLDNFQMNPNNELGREHTWLTTNEKMLTRIDALWVIVSRRQTKELFVPVFGKNCKETELPGFTKRIAEDYLFESCFNCDNEYDYFQAREDVENEKLVEKMLEVCDFNKACEKEKKYLPYLLRLVVLYYWNLREDPATIIKPELFAKLNEQDDFVGFYFYKDLSDLMVNAFQILSCLSTWDAIWIEKVREKFDNHLLNARNLLVHKAPIEDLDNGAFKLHEALRDGLYRNRQNYIKKDVLEYLFDSFINIYGNKNLLPEDREIWYAKKKIESFIEVVFEYILLEDERKNQKEHLEKIRPAMESIYADNCKRGSVGNTFISIYCQYIDKLGEIMKISFVRMHNNSFTSETALFEGENVISNKEKQEQMIYYMECCFKLADLYTNMTRNKIAWKLEELCVLFWERQMEQIEREQADYQSQVWYYRCWQQKLRALNAMAYDYSAEHQYEEAYKFGKEGLESSVILGEKLLAQIEMDQVEKETLRIMLKPEGNVEFFVDEAYTEIPHKMLEKMKNAYDKLREKSKENIKETVGCDSFAKVLYDFMITEQQKLRGNFPWYSIYNPKLKKENEFPENERRKEVCKYGVRTYWMRRALLKSTKSKGSAENMLRSYHNICVYLSKCGEYEKACILEKEVLEETLKKLKKDKLNEKSQRFLEEISGFEEQKLQKKLWENEGLNKSKGIEFFTQSELAVEEMQYLGDYYLQMGYYSLAQNWLSKVMLMRSVTYGGIDGKTLDTVIRFYIALYANREKDEKLLDALQDYVEEKLFRSDEYIKEWQSVQASNSLLDKFKVLKELMQMGTERIAKQENIGCVVEKMLLKL